MSRAINDPMVTHAVVVNCECHGGGVLAWCTEWEAHARARKLKGCGATVEAVDMEEDGTAALPDSAAKAIREHIGHV